MKEDQLYYVGQKAFIEKDGKLLILINPIFGLDFPGGKIQVGEMNLEKALQREVQEETGLEIEVGKPFVTWTVKHPTKEKYEGRIFLVGYICKYLSGEINLSKEHSDFHWITKENYTEFKHSESYYQTLKKYFNE